MARLSAKLRFVLLAAALVVLGCGRSGDRSPAAVVPDTGTKVLGGSNETQTPQSPDAQPAHTSGKQETLASSPKSFRIATYNINWGNPDLRSMVETIRQANADVVCLQETSPASETYLQRSLSKDYGHVHFQGHLGAYEAERFGFLSRLPLSEIEFIPPSQGLFGFLTAQVRLGDRTIRLTNVHLAPFQIPSEGGVLAALSALRAVEETHRAEVEFLLECVPENMPVVIAGDFNSIATFAAPTALVRRGLVDSFAAVNQDADTCPTWHWPLKHGELSLRIDYVFHSHEFRTGSSKVIRSDASDHYLLVSDLEWSDVVSETVSMHK